MSADFTILLPHKRNSGNDDALRIALDCLMTNTVHDFVLLMDAATDAPLYERVNQMVRNAPTECCVYWCSDLFAAPGWDEPMLARYNDHTFVTNVVVEPGVIGIDPRNIGKDFGRKPETFQREAFERWALNEAPLPSGIGFPAPYLFPRAGWLAHGGLEVGLRGDHHGFTNADVELFARWRASGNAVVRARSYVYHLQRWSELDEQTAAKREAAV
jgi:hypothetical protein